MESFVGTLENISEVIDRGVGLINGVMWDYLLLILLFGVGIYFTIRLGFIQIRKLIPGFKHLFGSLSWGHKDGEGGMSSFQAFATAVAGQVGTGNISGAATAIAAGGPGAIFWMWVSAFFGMATNYAEAILAQKFRTEVDGQMAGGPYYYIRAAFKGGFGKFLATFFSIAIVLALGFMGNMVQANSIGEAVYTAFSIPKWVMGLLVALVAGFVFFGGVSRIASFTEKVVPIMAILYIIGCIVVLIINSDVIGEAFSSIFSEAFGMKAAAGGLLGESVRRAMRYGVARGLFSNEAGMGSTPHAHALAKVEDPRDQGLVAMVGVFIDTFIILTLTALVILTGGAVGSGLTGTALAQASFNSAFGNFGIIFIAICLLFFAFSTIISWYFFGQTNVKILFGQKGVKVYTAIVLVFIVIGTMLKVDLVWSIADMFNGLMVLPNLLGLIALSGVVAKVAKGKE